MKTAAHILVTGLVQGVGFRFFVQRAAGRLGITGFVRNCSDGSVEIHAEGEDSSMDEFLAQVKVGPRSARVSRAEVRWGEPAGTYTGFDSD